TSSNKATQIVKEREGRLLSFCIKNFLSKLSGVFRENSNFDKAPRKFGATTGMRDLMTNYTVRETTR
ncbi:LOW QUALITY PROTEIN: hypothetical protein TorRG33x02_288720, partial [Trema orientale]